MLYWDKAGRTVSQPGQVQLVDNLFALVVHNIGTTIVNVDEGDPLQPGESKTFGGMYGAVYTGRLFITFTTPSPAPGTIINLAFVTQQFYVTGPNLRDPEDLTPILGQ